MQKLILGRALLPMEGSAVTLPLLIIAHQPTWGLDIGAVAYVQQQLIAARDAGAAVLVISDDLDEVLTLGDRIAVMHAGRLTEALAADAWTREAIGLAMAGVAPKQETGVCEGQFLALPLLVNDGPPLVLEERQSQKLAPSGGSAVHEVTSVGATSA